MMTSLAKKFFGATKRLSNPFTKPASKVFSSMQNSVIKSGLTKNIHKALTKTSSMLPGLTSRFSKRLSATRAANSVTKVNGGAKLITKRPMGLKGGSLSTAISVGAIGMFTVNMMRTGISSMNDSAEQKTQFRYARNQSYAGGLSTNYSLSSLRNGARMSGATMGLSSAMYAGRHG